MEEADHVQVHGEAHDLDLEANEQPYVPAQGNQPARGRRMNVPLPAKLELKGNLATNWRKFRRMWNNYEIVTRLTDEDNQFRTATLLTCIGGDALDIYDGLPFQNDDERDNINVVLQKFEEFCLGEVNETYEAYVFHKRHQQTNENIDTYITHLRKLIKSCNYGEMETRLLKDQIVIGVKDEMLRSKLLEIRNLTLANCIDTCRAYEASQYHTRAMNATPSQDEIHAVTRKKKFKKYEKSEKNQKYHKKEKKTRICKYCGTDCPPRNCPAYGKTCNICKNRNHFSSVCRFRKSKVHSLENEDDHDDSYEENEDDYVLAMNTERDYERTIYANMNVEGQMLNFQLDCGATINVMSRRDYVEITKDITMKNTEKTQKSLVMYNKTELKTVGQKIFSVTNPKNDESYKVRFVIVEEDYKSILGARAIQHMRLITVNKENIAQIDVQTDSGEEMMKKYEDVFQGEGKLEGELHLVTDNAVNPVKLPCRKWPLTVKTKVKKELDRLMKLGIITTVDTPTDWISSIAVAMKPSGAVRLCIDPKPLNKALKRNEYPIPTIDDILPELQGAYYFTHLDAKNGFWHVCLDEESSYLTTFETPFGKYRWLRMPFGISPAPEEFQRRIDNSLKGLNSVFAAHDDLLIWGKGKTPEEASLDHDKNLEQLLQRCRDTGLKLNRAKIELKKTEVNYLGHVISKDGLKADPSKLDAIEKMPPPGNKNGVQRLMGMVGYLQKFAPHLSEVSAPLRELVKKDINFRWDGQVHGQAFNQIKKILSSPPVLRYFDTDCGTTTLQCDASESGLGACLLQDGQPVQYASRALTSTEKGYAQIEKEMLAMVFGLEKFERYVYGRKVLIETDHQPLVTIHKKSLLSAPKRLQRMLLRMQKYEFNVVYKKGKEMYLADTLSRAFIAKQEKDVEKEEIFQTSLEKELQVMDMTENIAISSERLQQLQSATKADEELCHLMKIIQQGWPKENQRVPMNLKPYYTFREELSVQNGLVFKVDRIVVPSAARHMIMERLHASHTGIQGCVRRARETIYWPNMYSDIEDYVSKCSVCNSIQNNQGKEPMISHQIPELPWQYVACDLFECDKRDYLITVDFYSDFFEIDYLDGKAGNEVITKLKAHFARYGAPQVVMTDNGPPFNSQSFANFAAEYGFEHNTSSPGYAQSNGKAESAVKIAKTLLQKSHEAKSDPYLALLELRNIPNEKMGSSPVQRLFSRRTRTQLPVSKQLLKPEIQSNVKQRLLEKKAIQISYYNRSTRELSSLHKGDIVRFQPPGLKKWIKARVENQVDVRSYSVRTEDGRQYRRNRKHLRTSKEHFDSAETTMHRRYAPVSGSTPTLPMQLSPKPAGKNTRSVPATANSRPVKPPTNNRPKDVTPQRSPVKPPQPLPITPLCSQQLTHQPQTSPPKTDVHVSPQKTLRGRTVKRPTYLSDYVP